MSLTSQDLQAISTLMDEKLEKKLVEQNKVISAQVAVFVDKKLEQQIKDIAEVINQAFSTVDEMYATKVELAQVNQRISLLERTVALG